jgi:predicted metal-binding membrane protein
MHSWKDGKIGAVWMGIQHGAYCIVCCFGLMVILFLLGIMSILWMLVISFIVFIEKVNKHGELIARIIGVIMFICGLVIVLGLLPWWGTMM